MSQSLDHQKQEAHLPEYGDVDGFGHYGVLELNGDGSLLCAECGGWFGHLGLHVYKAHGITAAEYRKNHGLVRSRGLISAALREVIRQNAINNYDPAGKLAASRDPAAASASRLAQNTPVSAEEVAQRDARMSRIGRAARLGRVTTCGWCGVDFCPLSNALKRRYCSRRCSGKAVRDFERGQVSLRSER